MGLPNGIFSWQMIITAERYGVWKKICNVLTPGLLLSGVGVTERMKCGEERTLFPAIGKGK